MSSSHLPLLSVIPQPKLLPLGLVERQLRDASSRICQWMSVESKIRRDSATLGGADDDVGVVPVLFDVVPRPEAQFGFRRVAQVDDAREAGVGFVLAVGPPQVLAAVRVRVHQGGLRGAGEAELHRCLAFDFDVVHAVLVDAAAFFDGRRVPDAMGAIDARFADIDAWVAVSTFCDRCVIHQVGDDPIGEDVLVRERKSQIFAEDGIDAVHPVFGMGDQGFCGVLAEAVEEVAA